MLKMKVILIQLENKNVFCKVRYDGAIKYIGCKFYQNSCWKANPSFPQKRVCGKGISEEEYKNALLRLGKK